MPTAFLQGLSYRGAPKVRSEVMVPRRGRQFEADAGFFLGKPTGVVTQRRTPLRAKVSPSSVKSLFDVIFERERLKLDISYQKTECAKLTAELAHLRGNAVMRLFRKAGVYANYSHKSWRR